MDACRFFLRLGVYEIQAVNLIIQLNYKLIQLRLWASHIRLHKILRTLGIGSAQNKCITATLICHQKRAASLFWLKLIGCITQDCRDCAARLESATSSLPATAFSAGQWARPVSSPLIQMTHVAAPLGSKSRSALDKIWKIYFYFFSGTGVVATSWTSRLFIDFIEKPGFEAWELS